MADEIRNRLEQVVIKAKLKNICLGLVREIVDHLIENDVVPVVRCKDCIYCSEHYNICHYGVGRDVKPDHYCGYGERKIDDGK